jgi:hypothetical protein
LGYARDLTAVSALRGSPADESERKADPARRAIVLGTAEAPSSKPSFLDHRNGQRNGVIHACPLSYSACLVRSLSTITETTDG